MPRHRYDRAVEGGVFGPDARLELIEGAIFAAVGPQGSQHFTGIELVVDALRRTFGVGHRARVQGPSPPGEDSVKTRHPSRTSPSLRENARDFRDGHPTTALLVVEVSDDTLRHDRTVKQRLYARCGIPEYWILALPAERLEVHRDPADDAYRSVSIHRPGKTVTPLARPNEATVVDDLLP